LHARLKAILPFSEQPCQVSGEYSILKMAGENGIFNTDQAFIESFISFKRGSINISWH